jgi:hypothetical protein
VDVLAAAAGEAAHRLRRDLEPQELAQACEVAVERHVAEQERLAVEQRQREADERERLDYARQMASARGGPTPERRDRPDACLRLDHVAKREAFRLVRRDPTS